MTNEPAQPPQELFYEAIWTSEDMTDADKAHWLYETAKDYWERLEASQTALQALVGDSLAGLEFRMQESCTRCERAAQDDVVCLYCHAERPRKPPFRHRRDCPIATGRRVLKALKA